MAIDWRSIAEQVDALNPDGSEKGCGTDTGRRALEILIGEDNLRAAIDYFISLRPGAFTAEMVLKIIRSEVAMNRCLEIYKSEPGTYRGCSAVFLLGCMADSKALPWVREFLHLRVIIIDDDPNDIRIAARVATTAGFESIETFSSMQSAIERIEQGLRGEMPIPDAIILDLNLGGTDSGYEVLRHWRSTWVTSTMRLIVWSMLERHHQELCALFNPDHYVAKWQGEEALSKALQQVADESRPGR